MTYITFLEKACGYKNVKVLPDGSWAATHRFMFTCAILKGEVGNTMEMTDRWCYKDEAAAKAALEAWDGIGEPQGWHRHPATGRRRENGDPLAEYINH